jgi:hypothetical protein
MTTKKVRYTKNTRYTPDEKIQAILTFVIVEKWRLIISDERKRM